MSNHEEILTAKKEIEAIMELYFNKFEGETGKVITGVKITCINAFGNKIKTVVGVELEIEDNFYPVAQA